MRKSFFLMTYFLSLLFVSGNAQEMKNGKNFQLQENIMIEADTVNFEHNQLVLKGNALVENDLGLVNANEIRLTSSLVANKSCWHHLNFEGDVHFFIAKVNELTCSQASFDCLTYKGIVLGNANQDVVYKGRFMDQKGEESKFLLSCLTMDLFLKKTNKNESTPSVLDKIIANDQVVIDYNNRYLAYADQAIYHRESDNNSSVPFFGLLTLLPLTKKGTCYVTDKEHHTITADRIDMDTVKKRLIFVEPKGTFQKQALGIVNSEDYREGQMDFSAQSLLWDDEKKELILRDHIVIEQAGFGRLEVDEEAHIYQHMIQGKKSFDLIEAIGKTRLQSLENAGMTYELISYGRLKIDHQKKEALLTSPFVDGQIAEDKQVFFKDKKGTIYADQIEVFYALEEKKLVPKRILLQGNVKINNHLVGNAGELHLIKQYALADYVEFFPLAHEMLFKANPGNRVLFYDKLNALEISAPALKILRDKDNNKESFEGLGDVRFHFAEQEMAKLRQRFSSFSQPK